MLLYVRKYVIIIGYDNHDDYLFTLGAIFKHEIRPKIKGKEEFKTQNIVHHTF